MYVSAGRGAPIHSCGEQSVVRVRWLVGSDWPVSSIKRTNALVEREWRVFRAAVAQLWNLKASRQSRLVVRATYVALAEGGFPLEGLKSICSRRPTASK